VAVALDAVGPGATPQFSAGGTSISWTHVVAGSAGFLLVAAGLRAGDDTGMALSATAGGTAMTPIGTPEHINSTTTGFCQFFGLASPPTGNVTVGVSVSGGTPDELGGASLSFTGAGQAGTPVATAGPWGNTPTAILSTAASTNITAAVCVGNSNVTITTSAPFTANSSGKGGGASWLPLTLATAPSPGGNLTATFSSGGLADWAIQEVEVQPSSGPSYSGSPSTGIVLGTSALGSVPPSYSGSPSTGIILAASAAGFNPAAPVASSGGFDYQHRGGGHR
jgi:hypothetical protein